MTTTITDEQFNAAVDKYRRSRRKNPEGIDVYGDQTSCLNLTADGGRCVASQIMHDLGVRGRLIDWVGYGCTPFGMNQNLAPGSPRLTESQLERLYHAQKAADAGDEWWQALKGVKL